MRWKECSSPARNCRKLGRGQKAAAAQLQMQLPGCVRLGWLCWWSLGVLPWGLCGKCKVSLLACFGLGVTFNVLEKLTFHRLWIDAFYNPKAVLTLRIFSAITDELNIWGTLPLGFSGALLLTMLEGSCSMRNLLCIYLWDSSMNCLTIRIHSFHLNSRGTDASPCSPERDGCSFSATCCLTTRAHRTSSPLIPQVQKCICISSYQMLMVLWKFSPAVWMSSLFGRRGTPCLLPLGSYSKSDPPKSGASCTDPQHLGENTDSKTLKQQLQTLLALVPLACWWP